MAAVSTDRRDCDVLAVVLDVALMLENSAVFQSQVGDQLIALRAQGYATGLLAVQRSAEAFERAAGKRLRAAGVQVFLVEDRGFARNLRSMAATLRRMRRSLRIGVVYVRGVWGPVVLALSGSLRRIPYVYDVRGALADETRASGRIGLKQWIYAQLERWSIRRATRVTAVTHALSSAVGTAHSIPVVAVVPCCVDVAAMTVSAEQARLRRRELGYADTDVVLVYSGGLSHYQQVPAMLSLWRLLRGDDNVRFLLLTNDDPHSVPAIVGDLRDFGASLQHMSLPRAQVPATLAAADAGFMLRDARELNRVASPVKFAEYLAAGLAVVASPGTGDASGLIEQHRIGVLIDAAEPQSAQRQVRDLLATLRAEREAIRARARQLAAEHYDWQSHQGTFRQLYGMPRS